MVKYVYTTRYVFFHVHVHAYIGFHIGNYTYASVKGVKDYNFLKASFAPVWEEVGELIANPVVHLEGQEYQLDIVFGSDYKVNV